MSDAASCKSVLITVDGNFKYYIKVRGGKIRNKVTEKCSGSEYHLTRTIPDLLLRLKINNNLSGVTKSSFEFISGVQHFTCSTKSFSDPH